jgi:hypothetical protein
MGEAVSAKQEAAMAKRTGESCVSTGRTHRTLFGAAHTTSRDFALESLERRRLLSVGTIPTATLGADGILTVEGTDHGDTLVVRLADNNSTKLSVWDGYAGAHHLGDFDMADVTGIRMNGYGGDDYLAVHDSALGADAWQWDGSIPDYGAINIPVTMNGGDGEDQLYSESTAPDLLIGGKNKWDRAYSLGNGDHYAVDIIENLRIGGVVGSPNNLFWDCGRFIWKGDPDQIIADPWEVPNHGGVYNDVGRPVFPDEPMNNSTTPTPATTDSASSDDSDTGTAAEEPVKQDPAVTDSHTPLVNAPPTVFSLRPVAHSGDHLWDDATPLTA